MPFRSVRELSLRLLAAGVVGSGFALLAGPWLLHQLLPVFEVLFGLVQPGVLANFSMADGPTTASLITASAYSSHGLLVNGQLIATAESPLIAVTTETAHALLPAAIFLTALLFWPAPKGQRLTRAAWGIGGLLTLLCLTTPFLLAARVEMYIDDQTLQAGGQSHPFHSPLLLWMILSEMGGRWLLSIVLAIACIRLSALASPPPSSK